MASRPRRTDPSWENSPASHSTPWSHLGPRTVVERSEPCAVGETFHNGQDEAFRRVERVQDVVLGRGEEVRGRHASLDFNEAERPGPGNTALDIVAQFFELPLAQAPVGSFRVCTRPPVGVGGRRGTVERAPPPWKPVQSPVGARGRDRCRSVPLSFVI